MDWYYPVLGGALRGRGGASIGSGTRWDRYVVPGLGIRCVDDEPWVTGAESAECVMALDTVGMRDEALSAVRRHPAPARRGRLVLDRLAVRGAGQLAGRAVDLDCRRRRACRRRAVADRRRQAASSAADDLPLPVRLETRSLRLRNACHKIPLTAEPNVKSHFGVGF